MNKEQCGSCDKYMETRMCPREKRGLRPNLDAHTCSVYVMSELYKEEIEELIPFTRFDIMDLG